ncbi:MAG: VWFA-related domain-containing protein [Acidobacteria bacterium OLB17]|nr:MAG: VWFA-related domain-containing protein [Acidobacteria bacterium OLB17]MCZ2390995.1 VWA domain-containing protein [Acidobacteriota bacterium]
MRKNLLTILVTALFAVAAAAQDTPTRVPSPTPEDVVKITTSLVQVDVSVTDKDGRPVTDLKPNEIRIFENGKERKLSGLSFVAGEPAANTGGRPTATERSATLLPGKKLSPNEVRRAIAIVVDDLTLSFESVVFVRRTLRQFVDRQMQDGDLVAIIRSGGAMGALQQFTSDKRQLYAAIDRIHWNALGNGRIGTFNPVEPKFPFGQNADPGTGDETSLEDINKANAEYRENLFATGSLGALNYVIRGMRDLPGRKSVLMLSEGFRLFTRDPGGNLSSGRIIDAVQMVTDSANRAAVVVYTLDPRGLQVPMLDARDNTLYWTQEDRDKEVDARAADLRDTQDGLQYLADETGGFAIINTNDLARGIRKILNDQSYYLLAYEPDDSTFDPGKLRYNKIEVKVDRPGAKVRYRRGFYNVGDKQLAAERNANSDQRVIDAITSPFADNELPVHFNAIYSYDKQIGPFVRSLLHMNIADLDFKKHPDGKMKAAFDIFAYAFGENGLVAAKQQKTYTISLTAENYEKMRASGFVYDFIFPIRKPGAYQLRLAVRDKGLDKIGSASQFIEVPDLQKNKLTLSGVVLDSSGAKAATNPLASTAIREFKPGSHIDYGSVIFNAKTGSGGQTSLTSKIRVFRDGKLIFEGQPQSISQGQQPAGSIAFMGTVSLGPKLAAGDYVMEIAVTDSLAKKKQATALQYVEFSVTE